MKKFLFIFLVVIIFLTAIFGIWGYIKAQSVKEDGENLRQLTANLLVLEEVDPYSSQIPLKDWKSLADHGPAISEEVEKLSTIDEFMKQKMSDFFSVESGDKYREAQYLQLLIVGQERLNLKNEQPRTKTEIEEIISVLKETQEEINDKGLSLGPDLNQSLENLEAEADIFLKECEGIAIKMTFTDPPTQLKMANFDKASDELRIAIAESLNDHVWLQDEIKQDIFRLASSNWVNPIK